MWKIRLIAFLLLAGGGALGYFNYTSQVRADSKFPFKLGLDLSGGSHLVYSADTSLLSGTDVKDSMEALRDVIERRVNLFGVSEPLVQVEGTGGEDRLIVELPGVTDIDRAIALIGQTPLLEFKVERPNGETQAIIQAQQKGERLNEDPYTDSGLTGRYLEKAQLEFTSASTGTGVVPNEPIVSLKFNSEGSDLFAKITRENVGKTIAIYLDGTPISAPVVREEITGGTAQISGSMTATEAKRTCWTPEFRRIAGTYISPFRGNNRSFPRPRSVCGRHSRRYLGIGNCGPLFNILVSSARTSRGGCPYGLCRHYAHAFQTNSDNPYCRRYRRIYSFYRYGCGREYSYF